MLPRLWAFTAQGVHTRNEDAMTLPGFAHELVSELLLLEQFLQVFYLAVLHKTAKAPWLLTM